MLKIFYGTNTFARRSQLAKIKADFKAENGEYSIRELSSENLTISAFKQDLLASGLFATKELIIVNRAEDNIEIVRTALQAPISDLKEVILNIGALDKRTTEYKEVSKHVGLTQFDPLPEPKLKTWISTMAQKFDFSIDQNTIQDLILRTNADQQEVWICLNQLALLQKDKIELSDLDTFLAPSSSETAFNLLEAALKKEPAKFQKSLKELELFREDPYQIIALLCSQSFSLSAVVLGSAAGKSPQSIASEVGIHPFVASQQARLIRPLSLDKPKVLKVARVINWLDVSLKSVNKTEPWPMIDAALIKISVL